jgi:hypothetical protein
MKTTFDLPDELIRELKRRAAVLGRTVNDLVSEYLRKGIGMAPPNPGEKALESSMVLIGDNGLPVIRCSSGAPATRWTTGDILKLEQITQSEEDMQRAGLRLDGIDMNQHACSLKPLPGPPAGGAG